MGRRLFGSYYLYYASNHAAATISVANQLLREHSMLFNTIFHRHIAVDSHVPEHAYLD
jgi:hypothetical protein